MTPDEQALLLSKTAEVRAKLDALPIPTSENEFTTYYEASKDFIEIWAALMKIWKARREVESPPRLFRSKPPPTTVEDLLA